jgi:putative membrane protein
MRKITSESLHHFLRAAILLAFAVMILFLKLSGDISLYLAPQLASYVEMAAIGLFIIAVLQFYIAVLSLKENVILCDCGVDHSDNEGADLMHSHEPPRSLRSNIVVYGLFIFPLLLGFLLPNTALAGSLVQVRGMNLGGTAISESLAPSDLVEVEGNEDPALKSLFKTDLYNRDYAKLGMLLYQQDVIELKDEWFIEKMQSLNTFVKNFTGKQIKIKGFVYREDGMINTQFIVGRLAMVHCIADITPYGVIVEAADASSYVNDSWVTMTGSIGETEYQGRSVMKITISKVEPATAPAVPYVYPDRSFASKL